MYMRVCARARVESAQESHTLFYYKFIDRDFRLTEIYIYIYKNGKYYITIL